MMQIKLQGRMPGVPAFVHLNIISDKLETITDYDMIAPPPEGAEISYTVDNRAFTGVVEKVVYNFREAGYYVDVYIKVTKDYREAE